MKRTVSGILFGLKFLVGFGVLIYPTVSNQWNTYRQSKLITSYKEVVEGIEAYMKHYGIEDINSLIGAVI